MDAAKDSVDRIAMIAKGMTRSDDVGKIALRNHDGAIAVVKNGKVLAMSDIATGHPALVDSMGALPEGAEVITIFKDAGKVAAITSKSFHGKQTYASEAAQEAAQSAFK